MTHQKKYVETEDQQIAADDIENIKAESSSEHAEASDNEQTVEATQVDINNLQHKHKRKSKGKDSAKGKDQEIQTLKEQLLRLRADFDNYRKRMEKEKQDYLKYALEKSLLELLTIMDSFDRALHPDNETEETKHFYQGFALIYKQLVDYCKKQGVSEIEAVGQGFDPNLHQAVSQEQAEDVASGTVIKEYQKGYMFHKRVLRPSMVVVAE